jgi:hypothetical protein
MAYFQRYYTASSGSISNQFLIDLSAFASSNGWTIDLDAIYNTTFRRLHMHKGSFHVDIHSTNTLGASAYGCTGFNGGLGPQSQPGSTPSATYYTLVVDGGYMFVSTSGGLYIGIQSVAETWGWGALFATIENKIGAWSNGFGLSGSGANTDFGPNSYGNPEFARIYYNGIWSNTVIAGGVGASSTTSGLAANSFQWYNAGILPFPVLLFLWDLADSTKCHPMGFLPGLYESNGGSVYSKQDTIVIGADTFLIMPSYYQEVGNPSYTDFLFKLGA